MSRKLDPHNIETYPPNSGLEGELNWSDQIKREFYVVGENGETCMFEGACKNKVTGLACPCSRCSPKC